MKSEFKEERGMYFDSIDKNIALTVKQVISIPLTFAAIIFASYKVKDQPALLILILSASAASSLAIALALALFLEGDLALASVSSGKSISL